ncbi:ribonuclease H-like protein [Xylaria cf. heliscus]|nr:ribonuclease H-like protein [Xylaria cf. heliscus]
MPIPSHSEGHDQMDGDESIFKRPKHNPHAAGKTGGSCNLFPDRSYMAGGALCGTDNLEVCGFNGLMHVRCPWASTTPCSCGRYSLHIDSLVVAVDGACPGNGSQRATKSSCGVYFGPDAPENLAFLVPDSPGYSHTSQRAELSAAIAAIQASQTYIYNGGQWDCGDACPTPCAVAHLVIKSDSAYLVNGMTAHVRKWKENGWRTAKNTEVKNRDLWTQLEDLAHSLYDDTEVAIDFWHVPRDQNKEADSLANWALEE